ncbi:MAG: hypothetical protein AAGF97_12125 [Planctomycetota bacterium]
MTRFTGKLAILAVLCTAHLGWAQLFTYIDDDFTTDTSGDYTVVNGGSGAAMDGQLDFGFDYSTLLGSDGNPIGPAPGTTDGSTNGVYITVNETADDPLPENRTLFHNTQIVGVTDYTMTVDVYLGVWAFTADQGTTEQATVGLGADGVTPNGPYECCGGIPLNQTGSGHYVFFNGDSGDSSDYRHWRDQANGTANPGTINQFDPDYLSPDGGTNVTGDNFPFFAGISNANAPFPGVVGDGWATVRIEVSETEGRIRYSIRGAEDFTTGDPSLPPEFVTIIDSPLFDDEGFVALGLHDPYTGAPPAPNTLDQFVLYDNLFVEGVDPLGTSSPDCDFDGNLACDLDDIDMLTQATSSGSMDLMFDLNGDMLVNADDIGEWLVQAGADPSNSALTGGNPFLDGDANLDGVVDGQDFIVWNGSKFSGTGLYSLGDFNGDGITDGQDFIVWNGNKFTGSMDISSVPEPATATLLLLGALAMIRRLR